MTSINPKPSAGEPLEGQTLDGRFFIQRRLGAGSFGEVYLAEQRVFEVKMRLVALKLFKNDMVTRDNASEVLNDAIMLIQLQQEPTYAEMAHHLVTVYDAGFFHDRPDQVFMAMKYEDGYYPSGGGNIRTLHGLIRAFRPVPVDLALSWMKQILRPLAWMHTLQHPVLHCDLKPNNILVCGKDMLKVADFGLATLAFGIVGSSNAGGALTYQAPETLMGIYPTTAADVYSLGLIFYEILSGKNPLEDCGLEALVSGNDEQFRHTQIRARADGLPSLHKCDHPELEDHPLLLEIIERCLRFRASERYDNAAALLGSVEDYAAGETVVVLPLEEENRQEASPLTTLKRLLAEAQVLLRRNRCDQAKERCQQACQAFPKSGKPYRWLAEIDLARGRWKEALRICAQGQMVDPSEPELFEAMAQAYDMGKQPNIAKQMRKLADRLRREARE